jgi:hypothetical protein
MKVRRLFAVAGTAVALTLGVASAAHAADYPPTTVKTLGSTVTNTDPTTNSSANGLPFTGGNDGALVWVGVAAVGTGSFAAWRFRRRPRTS